MGLVSPPAPLSKFRLSPPGLSRASSSGLSGVVRAEALTATLQQNLHPKIRVLPGAPRLFALLRR